ncbi:MAG: hypothetical protein CMI21_09350 [Opitutae bacterium]|jgi:lipoate-protein ligase A|nr:hypothetical protein [Opitutae bacterium]
MATDWWLFLEQGESEKPAFRHYGWSFPEVTFGYGQDWKWVRDSVGKDSQKLVRRPTGGGIVRHGQDWTYCLILPMGHDSCCMPPLDLYEEIHGAIARALAEQDIATSLKPCPEQKTRGIPGDCFQEPVARDLMTNDGRAKVAGAAMKRARRGILVQGTIDLSVLRSFSPNEFYGSFTTELSRLLGESPSFVDWPDELEKLRAPFVERFASLSWLKNRVVD